MNLKALILALLFTNVLYGQPNNNDLIYFQVICGAGAETAQEIQTLKNLVNLKDSISIRKKLFEGSSLEQVLSAIVLKHYYTDGFLKPSPEEHKKIRQVSNSKKKFMLCFTCTYHQEGKVKHLFHKKKYLLSYGIIKFYLFNFIPLA
ncbi:hypothetical protein [Ferruginibacter sp.]